MCVCVCVVAVCTSHPRSTVSRTPPTTTQNSNKTTTFKQPPEDRSHQARYNPTVHCKIPPCTIGWTTPRTHAPYVESHRACTHGRIDPTRSSERNPIEMAWQLRRFVHSGLFRIIMRGSITSKNTCFLRSLFSLGNSFLGSSFCAVITTQKCTLTV